MGRRKLREYWISPEILTPSHPQKLENKIFLTSFWEPWTTEHELKHSKFQLSKEFVVLNQPLPLNLQIALLLFFDCKTENSFLWTIHFCFPVSHSQQVQPSLFTDQKKAFYWIHLLCFSMSSNLNFNNFKENVIYWTVLSRNTILKIIDNMQGFENIIWKFRY